MTKKKNKQVPCYNCPNCRVCCSSEDAMLDHFIRKHSSWKVDRPDTLYNQEDEINVPSNIHCHRDTEETPQQDDNAANEDQVNVPSHFFFQRDTDETPQQDVDTSQLLLILSNDVELNPGPTFSCKWTSCFKKFINYGELSAHIVCHIEGTNRCQWEDCHECFSAVRRFELHLLRHLYDNSEIFKTIDEWKNTLPDGKINEQRTDLHMCPLHLRSKLMLLLFDEDFSIPTGYYTIEEHYKYLELLSIRLPSDYEKIKNNFLLKRKYLGENWENDEGKCPTVQFNTAADYSPTPKDIYTVASYNENNVFVSTSRPELCNTYFSGTTLNKGMRKRRKSNENVQFNVDNKLWSDILIENLTNCSNALKLQNLVLKTLAEKGFVTSKKQSFFKLEQEACRLSAHNNCTTGTFVCSVFKNKIEDNEFYYVRYVESGVYSGFMEQKYLYFLKEHFNVADDNVLLHQVITLEDINQMKIDENKHNIKRNRPDKIFSHCVDKILPSYVNELNDNENCDSVQLLSYVVLFSPFKSKASVDKPEKMFFKMKPQDLHESLLKLVYDFKINQLVTKSRCSKDIITVPAVVNGTLLHQSFVLNCLSGNIKAKPDLFVKSARYESNFVESGNISLGTSLRNKTIQLFLKKDYVNLFSFYKKYFPELNECNETTVETSEPVLKKRKTIKHLKPINICRSELEKRVGISNKDTETDISEHFGNLSIFKNYCCSLLDHGTLVIQMHDDSGNLVCCLNDYCEMDGSFKANDFIFTTRFCQETGDYLDCTCKIYKTLLNVKEFNIRNEEFLVLDSSGDNCVTCMHCKFVKLHVLPCLAPDHVQCPESLSRIQHFVQKALCFNNQEIVEISRKPEIRKYSVLIEGDEYPAFVHFSMNKRLGKCTVSCTAGRCRSQKSYKRNISTLLNSKVCRHLNLFKSYTHMWEDLIHTTNDNNDDEEQQLFDDNIDNEMPVSVTLSTAAYNNFNEESGLWNFKCRSKHSPRLKDNNELRKNIIKRDQWNDSNLVRCSDGCLKGPVLFPDIPDNTCPCGSGWLKREDDDNYSENGLTIHERQRTLTIYTNFAPVKCDIHIRECYNSISKPCRILWDEGDLDCIHVLSRDTAAGDEIGWEFVSMVMNSSCTFSSYCQFKNEMYKTRHNKARFMDQTVFLNFWFSWASNMKIDFRIPCGVCGYGPKRLCCDGTNVGVGFRNSNYEEITETNQALGINNTLHRRMDRCFLKNLNGIDKQEMINLRTTLDYIARKELNEIKENEIIPERDLLDRIELLKQALPSEVLGSFERFYQMSDNERVAYSNVLKMLATTASITSLVPPAYCYKIQLLLNSPNIENDRFNSIVNETRSFAPELRDLICESLISNNEILPDDIRLFLQYLINESMSLQVTEPEPPVPQLGTYNPEKFGRAYYFNESGLKLRSVRKFSIDNDSCVKRNIDHDDATLEFEKCQKLYSKVQTSARGTSTLFLWFCADHGHCYGFHMTGAEGRKDPALSLYSYLETPPQDVFYDFACNLQEYCLNRESGYYKNVRFFHDIFHGYSHKCSNAFTASRLQGFESVNSEICEQFNSFIQCIKRSARQMSQSHFCFYLQFFLNEWNKKKKLSYEKKIRIALAGLV
ncbi:hypothetical protein DPMN_021694 [Dreissena polymorpha]|uniref:C2H2-type domain-containing protein n=3 Tax=Dreissena polymorpha TaxID=45954 RepID=A0A9D4NN80_DREPO|nr:hypothetical protein DPMN_021694 [Dreissena polymorpha]